MDKLGSKPLLIYTSDKNSEGSWTCEIKSIFQASSYSLVAQNTRESNGTDGFSQWKWSVLLFSCLALVRVWFTNWLCRWYHSATVQLDLMKVAIERDRHMVNPITCQVFLESACLFPKQSPNSFQGPKVRSNTIIHLESSFCLPGESNSRSLSPSSVFDLSQLFREYPAI